MSTLSPLSSPPYLGFGELIEPLYDLIALNEAVHAIHVEYQLSQSLQNVLLVGLVAELAHLNTEGEREREGERGREREREGGRRGEREREREGERRVGGCIHTHTAHASIPVLKRSVHD